MSVIGCLSSYRPSSCALIGVTTCLVHGPAATVESSHFRFRELDIRPLSNPEREPFYDAQPNTLPGTDLDHGLQHLCCNDDWLCPVPAAVDDPLLRDGHHFGRHLYPEVTTAKQKRVTIKAHN